MKTIISLLMSLLTTQAFAAAEDTNFFAKAFLDNEIQIESISVKPASDLVGVISNSLIFLDELAVKVGSNRLVSYAKNVSIALSGEIVQCYGWIGTQNELTKQERYISISDCGEMKLEFMGIVSLEPGDSFRPIGITIRHMSF